MVSLQSRNYELNSVVLIFLFPQTKVALQLYQVDHKSYLLDYKSLPVRDEYQADGGTASGKSSMRSSANSSFSSLKEANDSDGSNSQSGSHHTMEFLEMCANLIVALAC